MTESRGPRCAIYRTSIAPVSANTHLRRVFEICRHIGTLAVAVLVAAGCAGDLVDRSTAPPRIATIRTEEDVARALVGRWIGHLSGGDNRDRLLLIRSVTRRNGQWVVDAAYSFAERRPLTLPEPPELEVAGSHVILRFRTRANTRITMSTTDGAYLRGTFRVNYDTKLPVTFTRVTGSE